MRLLLIAILAGALSAGVGAQTKIYKVRMPDGRILFTDTPPPGATIVSESEAPPAPPPTPRPAPAAKKAAPPAATQQQQQPAQAQAEAKPLSRSEQVDKAYAAVQTAEAEVETARKQLDDGRAPKEGELLGTARGGVRPGPAYQERIVGLEKAVAAAEEKLAKARDELNAVR